MRLSVIVALMVCLLGVAMAPVLEPADPSPDQESAWVHLKHVSKFHDQLLPKGNYLIVHDDEKKAMGDPCLYVFRESDTEEPLVAIHCVRVVKKQAERTRLVWNRTSQNSARQFEYIQFVGSEFAHYAR